MANNVPQKAPVKRDEVLLQDIFSIYISNWKWILLSLFFCLAIAAYHILTTPPSYKCTSSLLIKQDKDGQSLLGDVAMSMTDIGLSQFKINTSNVIMTFQTPDIIHTVIQRLHLNDSYTVKGTFRDEILYGSSLPFTLSFIDMPNHGEGNLVACLKSDSLVHLTNFAIGDSLFKEEYTVHMGDTILSPLGHISVQRNNYYTGDSFTRPIQIAHISAYNAIGEFKEKLSVSLRDKMGTVFDLAFTDQSRERAIDVLKMVTNVYDEFWMQDKNKVTLSTVNFISQRLRILEDDLNSVDGEIATYKSSQRIPDIHATASYDLSLAGENERNLQQHANELTVAQYLLNFLKENKDKLMPANVGVTEQSIQSQIAEYNKLTLQRSRFVESSSEENLLVKDIDSQLSALRRAIISSVENYITALQLQLDSYESNRHEINSRISSNPKQAGHLLSAERQQKVKEGLYLFLLQKKEEFEISQAFTAYDTRVIMEPEYGGGDRPFSPNKRNVVALAFLLGLAVPFAFFYVKELLNTRVRGRKDLESLTVPYVGEIPLVSQKNRIKTFNFLRKEEPDEEVELVVKEQSRDIINEAFRVIRTNTEFMCKEGNASTIMTTSANINSGKTFISSNLALSFAINGRRVIALDLDLRKETLSKTFDCHKHRGIVDYLSGNEKDFHKLIVHQTVDILPAGKLPPNPAELLTSERLGELIAELRKEYDYIFIDCPPVEIVTDADIIKHWADMTLFVVRANLLEKALLPDIEKYYTEKRFNKLAIVLNGTESIGHYGYKYGYYKGKYGYYGHEN